jgi:hypothetical protein
MICTNDLISFVHQTCSRVRMIDGMCTKGKSFVHEHARLSFFHSCTFRASEQSGASRLHPSSLAPCRPRPNPNRKDNPVPTHARRDPGLRRGIAIAAPAVSADELAQRFAAQHAHHLRYVASRRRWFIRDGAGWRPDKTLEVFWRARQACLQAAAESPSPARNLAATVAAVERLARRDLRLVVVTETELGVVPRGRSARR